MTVKVEDYLSEEELKDICKEEFRHIARKSFDMHIDEWLKFTHQNDVSNWLSNVSYRMIINWISEHFDIDAEQMIRDNVHRVISELSSYCVFYKGGYGEPKSKGQIILEEEIENARGQIKRKVSEAITNYDFSEVMADVPDMVSDAVYGKLFGDKA